MALSNVIGWVVVRILGGGQVLIVSVEPRDEKARTPWGHSNVRHNFGYRGPLPLFSGVSWHLLKRKRRRGGSHSGYWNLIPLCGGRTVTSNLCIWGIMCRYWNFFKLSCRQMHSAVYANICRILPYLHSLWAHPKVRPSAGFWWVAETVFKKVILSIMPWLNNKLKFHTIILVLHEKDANFQAVHKDLQSRVLVIRTFLGDGPVYWLE